MRHSNISIFVPHIGCPNMCSFCNQHTISGTQKAPDGGEVRAICEKALSEAKSPENAEIAFFGGSFTAVPRNYMVELLEAAQDFVGEGKFSGIRISTRPDCIDRDILELLKRYHVTSIELGAQSMSDIVLKANDRGHTAADVENAVRLIREAGFELGLQMMIGLYKSSPDDELATVDAFKRLNPDTVRIYPVVILKGTRLAELYRSGEYQPFSFDEAVELSWTALLSFETAGIRVIKCGLHASEFVENDMVGGFYHPAFREICENRIYRAGMEQIIANEAPWNGEYVFLVNPSCISKAVGQNRCNIDFFRQSGLTVRVMGDKSVPKYECKLRRQADVS